ncbi:MAG: lipid-A-disaccharide synthase [Hyphomonadaceae bacterium]|nr:lipid-A-disaccharide synthase [Hyphomonadaceae bacterium]
MKLHFTAAEASGDLLAREVMQAILERQPDCELAGIGGSEMARLGIQSPFDIAPLSVLGLVEGLMAYSTVIKLADAAADHIVENAPDAAVLVDSWGFCLRVGQRVRALAPHIRLIKLAGPQVWASRPGRAKTLAATFDQVLCLHEMELPYYEQLPIEAAAIGVPALSRGVPGDKARFCATHSLDPERPILLVLPGSRMSEIRRVAPALMRAALMVKHARPDVQLVAMPAESIADAFCADFASELESMRVPDEGSPHGDAMAAADLALACSGTVTSELAMQGTPMVVAYKLGSLTYLLARQIFRFKHVTLLNIAAGDQAIVPEFIQNEMTPERLSGAATELLKAPGKLAAQIAGQHEALKAMGHGARPTPDRAAEAILAGLE